MPLPQPPRKSPTRRRIKTIIGYLIAAVRSHRYQQQFRKHNNVSVE